MEEEVIKQEEEIITGKLNTEDPRQKLMWEYYVRPKSETFASAKASAIKAGYSRTYANIITKMPWFKAKMRRMNLLPKAEKVLDKTLSMATLNEKGIEQADLLRVQVDAAKFVAKTLGKDEGYTERSEHTGKNGEAIVFMPVELLDKYKLKQEEDNTTTNG